MEKDDLEMSQEFYEYYAAAPIYYAFTDNEDGDVNSLLKEWNDKTVVKAGDGQVQNIVAAFAEASA